MNPVGKRRHTSCLATLNTIMTNIQMISRLRWAVPHNPTIRVTLPARFPKNTKIEWRNETLRCSLRARTSRCDPDRTIQRESRSLVSLSFKNVPLRLTCYYVSRLGFLFFGLFSFISTEYRKTGVVPCCLKIHWKLEKPNSLTLKVRVLCA